MNDSALRAMTDDAAFRVITVRTTQTVQDAVEKQQPPASVVRLFGDLLTGSILVRETMAPTHRVQAILKRQGSPSSILADSHPTAGARGLLSLEAKATTFPMKSAMLQVMRSLHDGRVHQGVVEVPDGSDVSTGLRAYLLTSEQVESFVGVSTRIESGQVVSAIGYLIQLLPGAGAAASAFMEEHLKQFGTLDKYLKGHSEAPEELMGKLLQGNAHTLLGGQDLAFGCWCSAERLLGALATLPRKDIDDFVRSGEVLEISCEYCNKEYRIPPAKLRGLQADS